MNKDNIANEVNNQVEAIWTLKLHFLDQRKILFDSMLVCYLVSLLSR